MLPEIKLSKGDWVFHPHMPGWGYGKVMEVLSVSKGRVFFLLAGEKKISWEHSGLTKVGNDTESQAALNEQLADFRVNLARDLLTSDELSSGVTCTACQSPGSKCELCAGNSENLQVYSLVKRGRLCLCGECRDRIMLETRSWAEIDRDLTAMEKRSKKGAEVGDKRPRKLKVSNK